MEKTITTTYQPVDLGDSPDQILAKEGRSFAILAIAYAKDGNFEQYEYYKTKANNNFKQIKKVA